MSDILSALLGSSSSTSASSSSSSTTYLDQLVNSYKATQKSKLNALATKKSTLENKKSFYSTLQSKMSTLQGNIDKMHADKSDLKFKTRTVTSSDTNVLTVSADSNAIVGVNSIKVSQLASNDILIGSRMTSADAFGKEAGDYTFKIKDQEITVALDGTETNEQAVTKIANAINSFEDTTLTSSVVRDTSSTVRLTFSSTKSGSENAITFDDNGSGLLNAVGLDNIVGRTATDTDSIKAHFKNSNSDELNSKLVINGIDITNSSNEIKNVLPGLTINLLKPQEEDDLAITTNTKIGTSAVVDFIKPLLDSYNDILSYVKSNTTIMRSETTINSLYSQLRNVFSLELVKTEEGDTSTPRYLSEIGIETNANGTLSITNQEKLEKILTTEDGWKKVSDLFTPKKDTSGSSESYGLASHLQEMISRFTGDDGTTSFTGLLSSRISSLNKEINSVAEKTTDVEDKIDAQAENLRKQYKDLLEIYYTAQSQYSSYSNMMSY
ncbi:MAG TPA: flagellar filament capping protein FliD [Candidatus Kapabacteria bacterium]|nr:flagellar filament capping protein FliD [Candidatus Kapabacteria bacterium]HPO62642.1 flagellar filament capping protein FliD [Candidatus Kapabacteria bacterium]